MTKILLVEDDKSLREIYGVRLLAEGYDIVSAGDGEEALAMAIKERPNLIVSDVMMPKISGFDMLDILRSTTETRGIKVIMMTALSSEDQRKRGEQLGADRYLVKSQVGIEDVVRTVHEVLADGHLTPEQRTADKQGPQMPVYHDQSQSHNATSGVVQPATQPISYQNDGASSSSPVQNGDYLSGRQGNNGQASSLPQPTAPFSTNRPAGLGERVIQPPVQNLESEMKEAQFEAELNSVLGSFSNQPVDIPVDINQQSITQPQSRSVSPVLEQNIEPRISQAAEEAMTLNTQAANSAQAINQSMSGQSQPQASASTVSRDDVATPSRQISVSPRFGAQ